MLADVPHPVNQTWTIHQVSHTRTTTVDRGTVSGDPFGGGSVSARSTLAGSNITLRFTEKLRRGTVRGTIDLHYRFVGPTRVRYSGSGSFTGGTGAFSGISGPISSFTGTNRGSRATLRLKGTASF
jgi:hypothetical protein